MRILFLGNNHVGLKILRYLKEQNESVVGLVLHPAQKQKFGDEIASIYSIPPKNQFDGSTLNSPDTLDKIKALKADIAISAFFGYILRPEFFNLFAKGCLNVHNGFLPFNRGSYANVWPIIEGTPAGATVHYVDEGVDTGDIVGQRRVEVLDTDTSESLYGRLEVACISVFKEYWPSVRKGTANRIPQGSAKGSFHRTRDVEKIDEIDLTARIEVFRLLDILRGRTFKGFRGAFFRRGEEKIYLRLQLLTEAEIEAEKKK